MSGAALFHGSLVALEALLRPLLYFAGSYRLLDRDPEADALLGLQIPGWLD